MGMDATAYLLFIAVGANQMGRVMIPALKTSVLGDAVMGAEFKDKVGAFLSGVSLVCLAGKLIAGAVTDKLGGWLILISVFVIWIVATIGSIFSTSVDMFGYAWLINSFAYTITWGAVVQVIGVTYEAKDRSAVLTLASSGSRFGATLGNIFFGQLLTFGVAWRNTMYPILIVQALLLLMCIQKWSANSKTSAASKAPAAAKAASSSEKAPSILSAFLDINFYLMLIPKTVLFTYTQFFMNYIPQLLKDSYGYDDGMAATLGGVAQGGSVIGLLYVGNIYKSMSEEARVKLIFGELAVCAVVPYVVSLGPAVLGPILVVPLLVIWGLAYALPFYNPPGEFAMNVGGKYNASGLFTNIFDAAGFTAAAVWNPWASNLAKTGDFKMILLSQALFGAISVVTMPLCMHRLIAKDAKKKKA